MYVSSAAVAKAWLIGPHWAEASEPAHTANQTAAARSTRKTSPAIGAIRARAPSPGAVGRTPVPSRRRAAARRCDSSHAINR